jgi:hypothetical protein
VQARGARERAYEFGLRGAGFVQRTDRDSGRFEV